MRARDTGSALK